MGCLSCWCESLVQEREIQSAGWDVCRGGVNR